MTHIVFYMHVYGTYRIEYVLLSSFYNQCNWGKDMGSTGYRVKKECEHRISLFPTFELTCLAHFFEILVCFDYLKSYHTSWFSNLEINEWNFWSNKTEFNQDDAYSGLYPVKHTHNFQHKQTYTDVGLT